MTYAEVHKKLGEQNRGLKTNKATELTRFSGGSEPPLPPVSPWSIEDRNVFWVESSFSLYLYV